MNKLLNIDFNSWQHFLWGPLRAVPRKLVRKKIFHFIFVYLFLIFKPPPLLMHAKFEWRFAQLQLLIRGTAATPPFLSRSYECPPHIITSSISRNNNFFLFLSSLIFFSPCFAISVSYPLDLVRRRLQVQGFMVRCQCVLLGFFFF